MKLLLIILMLVVMSPVANATSSTFRMSTIGIYCNGQKAGDNWGTYYPNGARIADHWGSYYPNKKMVKDNQGTYYPNGVRIADHWGSYYPNKKMVKDNWGVYYHNGQKVRDSWGCYMPTGVKNESCPEVVRARMKISDELVMRYNLNSLTGELTHLEFEEQVPGKKYLMLYSLDIVSGKINDIDAICDVDEI